MAAGGCYTPRISHDPGQPASFLPEGGGHQTEGWRTWMRSDRSTVMKACINRRCFLHHTGLGLAALGAVIPFGTQFIRAASPSATTAAPRTRVGRVYLGHPHPGWPSSTVDLDAEVKRFEDHFAQLAPELADIDFVDAGLVQTGEQLAAARAKFQDVDGILAIHVTMGTGPAIKSLIETGRPVMVFFMPYSGHEWHIIAGLQREGKLVEALPSSDYRDLAVAVRPFRALRRLRETRVLHVSQGAADPKYCEAIRARFGTEIRSLGLPELEQAWKAADDAAVTADADRWIREAEKVVEPTREEIVKGARMSVAMQDLMAQHGAIAVTMNCLGMGLVDRGMGYPCLGFVRMNNVGQCGVCEADLKSTMTQLIFQHLVGKPGFVTDPLFDYATSAIIHAHCVAATQMEGPGTAVSPYVIRSHLEDGKGVSLQVRLPVGQKVSMARLIGTDLMLFSTGDAVDSPFEERACRTKLTMKVANPDRFLENWSCGLHRVVFYGDHTRDLRRFCRFAGIRILREGEEDLRNVPGLEWETYVHA